MPSIDLIIAILVNLAPYFLGAMALAVFTGFFIPWSVDKPAKWLYFYIFGITLVFSGASDGTEGSAFKQYSWVGCYALCVTILYRTRQHPELQKVHIPVELWILLAWMLLSITWSPYGFMSLKRYLLIIGSLLVGVLTTRMTPDSKSSVHFLLMPLVVCVLLGVVHAVAFPDRAFGSDGAMRGYAVQKNPWGQLCLLCALVFLHAIVTRKNKLYYLVLMVPTLVMLYLSQSTTSIMAFIGMSLVMFTLVSLMRHRLLGITLLSLFLAITSVVTLVFTVLHGELPFNYAIESIFKAADKSTTLTGRTQLWYLMWGEISRHLWTGTGIGGFWAGLEGASGALSRKLDWGPPGQAHSGYIDVLNEIGIIGSVLLLLLLIRHAVNCWKLCRRGHLDAALFHCAVATAFLTINYAESSFFLGASLWFIVFLSSIVQAHSMGRTADAAEAADTTRKTGKARPRSVTHPPLPPIRHELNPR